MIILHELVTVADKLTGNGYLIRDLRPLQDGHHYFPAFAIPYFGKEIAALNNKNFAKFWKKTYAELLGRSKAKLLMRYGLQMVTPNAQNMLIQFDQNWRPTGVLVFRDISDTQIVFYIAKALGFEKEIEKNRMKGANFMDNMRPHVKASLWQMNGWMGEAKDAEIPNSTLKSWEKAHDIAYIREIQSSLGLVPSLNTISRLEQLLKSKDGEKLIQAYARRAKINPDS